MYIHDVEERASKWLQTDQTSNLFDADYNGKWEDDIKIYVDNEYVGTLNEWFNTNPGCYTSGCVTISKPPGHYRWEAKSSGGFYWSGGDFEILEGECGDQRMWVN